MSSEGSVSTTNSVRAEAWAHHQRGLLVQAEQLYRQLLRSEPDKADAVNLGALLRKQGRLAEALQLYEDWLSRFDIAADLSLNAANCAIAAGALHKAELWLEAALRAASHSKELIQAKARLYQAQQRWPEAISILNELRSENPKDSSVLLDLGLAHYRQGQREEALEVFGQLTNLVPDDPRGIANKLTVLGELGRWSEAQDVVNALTIELKKNLQIRAAKGRLLMAQQLMEEASKEFEELCILEPTAPLHWLNLAACLRSLKHNMAAMAVAKRGAVLHPLHEDLQHSFGQCLAEAGQPEKAMTLLNRQNKENRDLTSVQMFNLQFLASGYQLLSPKQLALMARHWETKKLQKGLGRMWADRIRRPTEGRPLRVGYLSADFCNHPVGRFMRPILEEHDETAVEVVGLSCGTHNDSFKQHLRDSCKEWHELQYLENQEAARLISDLQLDLLVELGGYTAGSRAEVLIYKPAPIQLSYLGYFAPTYLKCIDGWIGDAVLFEGLDEEERRAHKLLEVQGGYMAYTSKGELPEPQRYSERTPFRFGCFNHTRKLTRAAVNTFVAVMNAVPHAELVLKSISFIEVAEQKRIRQLFSHFGLCPNRLILLPWVAGYTNHLKCYSEIDVALDPQPYGGATTTCEAIAMGVPVVSLAGRGMVGRLSASILTYANCNEWIAETLEEFVAIAANLAAVGPRLKMDRLSLRQRVYSSQLCDGRRLASELENIYRHIVRRKENESSS